MLTLNHYLVVSGILFAIGTAGVVLRRNALVTLMSLEITLNAANLSAVAFSRYLQRADGQILYFFIIVVAAAEVAVGLAILVALFRRHQSIDLDDINRLTVRQTNRVVAAVPELSIQSSITPSANQP